MSRQKFSWIEWLRKLSDLVFYFLGRKSRKNEEEYHKATGELDNEYAKIDKKKDKKKKNDTKKRLDDMF